MSSESPVVLTPVLAVKLTALGFLLASVFYGLVFFLIQKPQPAPIVLHPPPTPAPTALPEPTATPGPLTVFVSGGVAQPGLYTLPWGARIGDALKAAGGLVAGSDPSLVNQAERLFDGAQVHVPVPGDQQEADVTSEPPAGLSGATQPSPESPAAGGLININTASAQELISLPGIGPSKAAAIIANRPYDTPDDLGRVPGIGAKTLAQLRELITTQ